MSDIQKTPKGWEKIQLGEIIELEYGKGLPKRIRNKDGKFPVYGSNGQVGNHDEFLINGPSIIVGRKGSAGAVHYSNQNCWPIDTTYFVRNFPSLNLKFWYYLMGSLNLQLLDKSTTIPGLNRNDAYAKSILVPPLNEQKRIVSKIEELFSELDNGIANLKLAQNQLKLYRQTFLKDAFEGKYIIQKEIKFSTIGDHIRIISGNAFKKSEYSKSGVRLFQIANVSFNKTSWKKIAYLPESYLQKPIYKDLILNEDDIVMALNRPLLNRKLKVAKLSKSDVPAILYQRVGKFEFDNKVMPNYFLYFLQSPQFIEWLEIQLKGVNIPFINQTKLLSFDNFPLPLIEDQRKIVSLVESRISIIDNMELTIEKELLKADLNKQSILKKAYKGKLVVQDPNDEPADILLQQIKEEKYVYLDKQKKNKKIIKRKDKGVKKLLIEFIQSEFEDDEFTWEELVSKTKLSKYEIKSQLSQLLEKGDKLTSEYKHDEEVIKYKLVK